MTHFSSQLDIPQQSLPLGASLDCPGPPSQTHGEPLDWQKHAACTSFHEFFPGRDWGPWGQIFPLLSPEQTLRSCLQDEALFYVYVSAGRSTVL